MKVLVTASSRHGSTLEVADAIAARLADAGFTVEQSRPEDVQSLEGFGAVIVGSSVYLRQWGEAAKDFVSRFRQELRDMPSWAFSVGMADVPKSKPEDVRKIGPVAIHAVFNGQKVFPGRYDPTSLSLRERSIGYVAGAVEGDYRDWEDINAWADTIAEELSK